MIILLLLLFLFVLLVVFFGRGIIIAVRDERRKVAERRNIEKFIQSDN